MLSRLVLAAVSALSGVCASGAALTLTTEEYPPFNMTDAQTGAPAGIAVDKVVEMMRRANEPYTITSYPWARAYQMALKADDTCVFSTSRTPERETLFTWIGPLARSDWAIFARASDARKPKALEEVRPFTIGSYLGAATGEYLKVHGYKVDLSINETQNIPKLVNNRIDYWATGEMLGKYMVGKAGLTGQIVPLFRFELSELYVACNRGFAAARAEKLNRVLKEMDRDGTSATIERKYQ
jgi:polar amino acid transport system substrate-binding protein